MTTDQRDDRALLLLVLWLTFALAVFAALRADLTPAEAVTLWAVRDVEPVTPGAPQAVLRAVVTNARAALDRADSSPFSQMYTLTLELWTRLTGESLFAARLFSSLSTLLSVSLLSASLRPFLGPRLALIVVALAFAFNTTALVTARSATQTAFLAVFFALAAVALLRFIVRWRPAQHLAVSRLAVAAALCVGLAAGSSGALLPLRTDWQTVSAAVHAERHPTEPALTALDPRSPAAYYALRKGLTRGLALDLAWRDPDPAVTSALVEAAARGGGPLWLMMPNAQVEAWALPQALAAAGYTPTLCLDVDDVLFHRYTRNGQAACAL